MIAATSFRLLRVTALLMLTGMWACTAPLLGRDFARPDYATYSKKRIAESDITARYGPPYSRNKFTHHGVTIETLDYVYAVREWGGEHVLVRKKTCSFFFCSGHYLGYDFGTGFQDDQVPLAEQKLSQLVKGQTKKADALAMFGAPASALRYPATPDDESVEGDSTVSYEYIRYSGQGAPERYQFVMLTFDAKNVLRKVDLDSRERAPDPAPAVSPNTPAPNHWGAARPLP